MPRANIIFVVPEEDSWGWLVRLGARYLYGSSPLGRPVWGPFTRRACRFDTRRAAECAARWAASVFVEIWGAA